jgi:hypothetical protein
MEKTTPQFVWNGVDLDALRHVMDKPADNAVLAVFESNSMDHLRALLTDLAKNDSMISDELPKPMFDFVKSELNLTFTPEDISLFEQTHEIWKRKGMRFIFILFFRALPYTYMAEKPANVLRMTKLLIDQPERRIFETAQFVFDVMDEKWWEPEKRGILTAMKVRIMHAAMRHVILNNQDGEKWNETWGKPISQEDLVATNQVFSLEFFKGMKMLDDELSAEEQNAWFHTWKTIGRIMGVQDELICKDVNEAWKLQHKVYDHLFRDETAAGIPLTKALVGALHHFHLPTRLTLLIMRQMLADDQFPDCFERMLAPSFENEYPELFLKHDTIEEKEKHEKLLRSHFHQHVKDYLTTVLDKKPEYRKIKRVEGFIERIIAWINQLLGRPQKEIHLFESHLGAIKNLLHLEKAEDLVDEMDEKLMLDTMKALGPIMVGILSLHFRKGKQSGFRIPHSLKENWSIN